MTKQNMINNQENYQQLMKMPPSTTPPILHHGITAKQIILLREELDIEDEMNEEETKELDDDPYFLLAQRLANAPQVKVSFRIPSRFRWLNFQAEEKERN